MGSVEMKLDQLPRHQPISIFRAWLPYVLVGALVLSRVFPRSAGDEVGGDRVADILGEKGIKADFQPLYLPGGILVAVVLITVFLHGMHARSLVKAVGESSRVLLGAGFVLLFCADGAHPDQLGVNAADLPSMPIAMAKWVADSVGNVYPLLAPSVGALSVPHRRLEHGQQHDAEPVPVRRGDLARASPRRWSWRCRRSARPLATWWRSTTSWRPRPRWVCSAREGAILRKTFWPTVYYVLMTGTVAMIAITSSGCPIRCSPRAESRAEGRIGVPAHPSSCRRGPGRGCVALQNDEIPEPKRMGPLSSAPANATRVAPPLEAARSYPAKPADVPVRHLRDRRVLSRCRDGRDPPARTRGHPRAFSVGAESAGRPATLGVFRRGARWRARSRSSPATGRW